VPTVPRDWCELYAHIVGSEHVWLARITGEATDLPVWPLLDLSACRELTRSTLAAYRKLIAGLDEAGLARRVAYVNSAGATFENTVEDMLVHVAMHGSYHRGQIAAAMRAAGLEPSPTDYIAFIRGAPAATRQR